MTGSLNDPVAADADPPPYTGPGAPLSTGTARGTAPTRGQTAGLPGENAAPDVVQFDDSERAATVDMGTTPLPGAEEEGLSPDERA